MNEIGLLGAFLGGLLTLISPCSAMLLPSFFAYAFDGLGKLVARTTVFYLGLATTLVPLGAAAGLFGALLTQHRTPLTLASGLVLILLGLLQISGKGFGFTTAQQMTSRIRISSGLSVYALGTVYGLAGFCAGPVLGSVLTVSAAGGEAFYGATLLALFALGMTVPLFLLALLWERFQLSKRTWLRGREITLGRMRLHTTNLSSGLMFAAIGVMFMLTEGTASLGGLTDVDTQFAVQAWLQHTVARVSNTAVLLILALIALAAVLWKITRIRRTERTAPVSATTRPSEQEPNR